MEIKNVTEFRNFVNNNGLRGLHPDIDATTICVMDYERGCNCWKGNDRQKIYNNCRALYLKSMRVVQGTFANHFLGHCKDPCITFMQDGILIGTLRR